MGFCLRLIFALFLAVAKGGLRPMEEQSPFQLYEPVSQNLPDGCTCFFGGDSEIRNRCQGVYCEADEQCTSGYCF